MTKATPATSIMSAFLLALLWAAGAWPAWSQTDPVYAWTNFVGQPGNSGSADGTGSAARFYYPSGPAVDRTGNVFVADSQNHTIREVTPSGVVTTLAGSAGNPGSADGTGSAARFYYPVGVAVDTNGNVFVADSGNCTIRKITPGRVVTTLAGSAGSYGSADGTGGAAQFAYPQRVAVDSAGNVFVVDYANSTIRKVTSAGVVTTLAGSAGSVGSADGTGSAARFNLPDGIAVDRNNNVFVADSGNSTIRKVTPAGVVTTLAGSAGASGSADGTGSAARFYQAQGVAVDSAGNVFVADTGNQTMRKLTSAGAVTTIGGVPGVVGAADGIGSAASFSTPTGVAADSAGNLYVTDYYNNRITKGTPITAQATTIWNAGADLEANEVPVSPGNLTNPNGTVPQWSYGYRPSVAFVADPTVLFAGAGEHTDAFVGNAGVDGWSIPNPFSVPAVVVNTTGATIPVLTYGAGPLPDAEILCHPGDLGATPGFGPYTIVRWTAPSAGNYSASAHWQDIGGGNGEDVHVVVNGSSIFDAITQTSPGPAVLWSNILTLASGDKVDFVLGPNGYFNYDSTDFNATLVSAQAVPVARCTNVIVSAGANCLAAASVNDGSYDPYGGPVTVSQVPPGPYPLGTNLVTLNVADNRGGSNSCAALVIVLDTTPPEITCPANITAEFTSTNGAVVTFAPAATDNCSGAPTVLCQPASGSIFPIGTTTVACTATDLAANAAHCQFQVTVLGARGVLSNVLAELRVLRAGLPAPGSGDRHRPDPGRELDDAIGQLADALTPALWLDQTHLAPCAGQRVFRETELAVGELEELIATSHGLLPDPTLQEFISRIVRSDWLLAAIGIQDAAVAGMNGERLRHAREELARGDAAVAAGRYQDAIDHYQNAWGRVERVLLTCAMDKDGRIRLRFPGAAGRAYRLEASTNLLDWVPLGICQPVQDGDVEFLTPDTQNYPLRFYRIAEPQSP